MSRRHIGATGSSGLLFGMVGGGQTLSLEVVSNQAFYGDELMGHDGHSELPGPNMPPVYLYYFHVNQIPCLKSLS